MRDCRIANAVLKGDPGFAVTLAGISVIEGMQSESR